MDVVCRERRREQPGHELAHLVGLEVLACFDGGATGVRRREPLQPIGEPAESPAREIGDELAEDRKSTRLNSSHGYISYAVFCLKKKNKRNDPQILHDRIRKTQHTTSK